MALLGPALGRACSSDAARDECRGARTKHGRKPRRRRFTDDRVAGGGDSRATTSSPLAWLRGIIIGNEARLSAVLNVRAPFSVPSSSSVTTTIGSPSSTSLALPRISVATRAGPPTRSIVATHAAGGCIADILADRAVGVPASARVHGRAAAVAASTSLPMRAGPVLRAACNPTGRRRAAPRPAACIADKLADRAAGQPGLVGACVWPVDRHGSCRPANSRTAAEPAAGSYRSLLGAGGGTAAPAARGARSCADKNACGIIDGIAARLSAVHNVHEPSRVFRLPTQTRAGLPSSTVPLCPATRWR